MQPIVTAEEMRWCDERTIGRVGVPGLLLMENAGRSVVDLLDQSFAPLAGKHVVVVCGKGNNGGDGFVAARHLSAAGTRTTVLLAAPPSTLRGDAKTNLVLLQRVARDKRNALRIRRASPRILQELEPPDLIVDALFGTGFTGDVRGSAEALIAWMNEQDAPVLAVDIPSGVNGTTGRAGGMAVEATATVTFGLLKSGLVLNDGREAAGRIYVSDIGIPRAVVEEGGFATMLAEGADVRARLPKRPFNAHKYSTGKVLVIAGSRGYTGAAALCATSALRSGAGAVMLLTPDAVYPILARKLTEVIVRPLPSTREGTAALIGEPQIREHLAWADVVVLGPGLSQHEEVRELVRRLIERIKGPLLLDADGLNAVAAIGTRLLERSKADILLTPHAGEFARLSGKTAEEIETMRPEVSRQFAARHRVGVVLKGVPTATASADGSVVINATGNPGMATVGSGDVLAGIIGGFWAQGMSKHDGAWCGAYVHGLCGDAARDKLGERSLVAGDLIEMLPEAFRRIDVGDGE